MNEEERLALFEDYANGLLNEKQKKEFEEKLKDKRFLEQYELYKESVLIVKAAGFKSEVSSVIDKQKKSKTRQLYIPLGIAAAVSLFISFYFLLRTTDVDSTQLFKQYYQPYPDVLRMRTSSERPFADAMIKYEEGNYDGAITYFNQYSINNDTVQFYKALSHLSLGQTDSARFLLQRVPKTSTFADKIKWYEAMSFLFDRQTDAAITVLNDILPEEYNYQKSIELKEVLK